MQRKLEITLVPLHLPLLRWPSACVCDQYRWGWTREPRGRSEEVRREDNGSGKSSGQWRLSSWETTVRVKGVSARRGNRFPSSFHWVMVISRSLTCVFGDRFSTLTRLAGVRTLSRDSVIDRDHILAQVLREGERGLCCNRPFALSVVICVCFARF